MVSMILWHEVPMFSGCCTQAYISQPDQRDLLRLHILVTRRKKHLYKSCKLSTSHCTVIACTQTRPVLFAYMTNDKLTFHHGVAIVTDCMHDGLLCCQLWGATHALWTAALAQDIFIVSWDVWYIWHYSDTYPHVILYASHRTIHLVGSHLVWPNYPIAQCPFHTPMQLQEE